MKIEEQGESLQDILAEMRKVAEHPDVNERRVMIDADWLSNYADRIEAATSRDSRLVGNDEIIIQPSPSADTRSADHIITESELRSSTEMHINDVRCAMEWICRKLLEAGDRHDWTKVQFFDEFFHQFSKAQKTGEWGKGWYDEIHVKKERHHLNNEVPADVTLIDVLEMIADGVVAGKARTGKFIPEDLDAKILKTAYANTQRMVADAVHVATRGR